jgi:hypothetical protein
MPEHEEGYQTLINNFGDVLRVRWVREENQIRRFTAQYEVLIDDDLVPAVRYDTAHGTPHRDLLNWDGRTRRKEAMSYRDTYADAMNDAIDDLTTNWERYRFDFLRRRP